ncbi:hypothetical protein GCM10018790_77100 [Kitasatospora xanthocidica]|uniref:hypothetical protein n=1 Tax=Kitasatospora xanthocidica TaxID=83382 RepID=UPI00167428C1|nr:hypothetical protein [Kitasatospora xanthocidica]GHF88189.1 hypothetical protein GCM10018790_77100 [Kitasatospora xanthocidica]
MNTASGRPQLLPEEFEELSGLTFREVEGLELELLGGRLGVRPRPTGDSAEVTVFSRPNGVRYELAHALPSGKTVHLPEPVGISLDTEPLKDWVR